jgi:hypothetical protein
MIEDYRVTQQSINNTYENGLLTKPTPLHSMYMSGIGGFITGYKFVGDIYSKAVGLPENRQLKETLELIEREKTVEGQSMGQRSLNWIGDMVGYSISPPVLALGGLGGAVARGLSIGARAIAPKAVLPFLERQVGTGIVSGKAMTVGDIGERLAGGALAGEFSMVPLAFAEGKARVATEGGALGFALSSVPILLGMRKGLKAKGIKVEEKPSIIPQEEVKPEVAEPLSEIDKWNHDYENKLDTTENLTSRATKILQKEGLEVNPVTHEVQFNLLNENDVRNLQAAVTDSITSNVSDSNKNHLIDYIINNRIDELRSNPKSQIMLKAYDNYITGKLSSRESIISDADKLVSNVMKEKITNKAFLSQPEIEKAVKKLSKEESHVSQLPFTLPENIEKRIKLKDRIAELKKKEPVRAVIRRIKELESKIPKVMKPKEELQYLSNKILKGKEYRNKLKSRAYQRLQELADHWTQARALMERIHLQEEFENQQAIKDAFDKLRKEVEKPIDKSARTDDVITYLKERIEGIKPRKNPMGEAPKTPEQIIKEASKVPADIESVLKEHENLAKGTTNRSNELKKKLSRETQKKINFYERKIEEIIRIEESEHNITKPLYTVEELEKKINDLKKETLKTPTTKNQRKIEFYEKEIEDINKIIEGKYNVTKPLYTTKELENKISDFKNNLKDLKNESSKQSYEEAPKTAKELRKELVKDNDRINQFKSSGKALDEFVQCVLGSK